MVEKTVAPLLVFYQMFLRFIVIRLGVYTLYLLFYCFYSYIVAIFEQPLAQEFPSGLIQFYLILS